MKLRLKPSPEEKALKKEKLRERVAILRLKQSQEKREYDKIRKKTKGKRDKKRLECRRALRRTSRENVWVGCNHQQK